MAVMQAGHHSERMGAVESLAYVSFQELATRIAHRNTGRFVDDPIADQLLTRVAADENLHMVFYRSLVSAALEIDPSETVRAIAKEITSFAMPGTMIPNFSRKSLVIAKSGIYNLRIHHDEVVRPMLKHWRVFDIEKLDATAEQAREQLAVHLDILQAQAEGSRSDSPIAASPGPVPRTDPTAHGRTGSTSCPSSPSSPRWPASSRRSAGSPPPTSPPTRTSSRT